MPEHVLPLVQHMLPLVQQEQEERTGIITQEETRILATAEEQWGYSSSSLPQWDLDLPHETRTQLSSIDAGMQTHRVTTYGRF